MVSVRRLVWDAWNVAHIARHSIVPAEVEEVCHGEPIERTTYRGRIVLIGPTVAGRTLTVVLEPETEHVYYPITARPSSRNERREYAEEKARRTS